MDWQRIGADGPKRDDGPQRWKERRHVEAQDRFIEKVREVAHDCGYAVAIHGSRRRDLDLIAVPWVANAVNPYAMVEAICERCDLFLKPEEPELITNPERKPNGRIAWALCGAPACDYLDLSVFA